MKKLLVTPLILSVAFLVTACGEKVEQMKNDAINKAASVQLDKVIEEKAAVLKDGASDMVDSAVDGTNNVVDGTVEVVEEVIDTPTEVVEEVISTDEVTK